MSIEEEELAQDKIKAEEVFEKAEDVEAMTAKIMAESEESEPKSEENTTKVAKLVRPDLELLDTNG